MAAYSPINAAVYVAAAAGGLSGIYASGGSDTTQADYAAMCNAAYAFAQQMDINWTAQVGAADQFQLAAIGALAESFFTGRSANSSQTPAAYGTFVNAIIAAIQEMESIITAGGGFTPGVSNTGLGFYGDGSDGVANANGVGSIPGATLNGSTYTLSRDVFYTNLTVAAGVTVVTAGFRVFCTGTISIAATGNINNNGGNASGVTAGTGGATGNLAGGAAGGNGGNNSAGTNGTGVIHGMQGATNTGGAGAAGGGNAGGTGGTVTNDSIPLNPRTAVLAEMTTGGFGGVSGGAGGGGGGSSAAATTGGGGGGGGGNMLLAAPNILYDVGGGSPGYATVFGGSGGNAAGAANGGGGGGGGGGVIITLQRYSTFSYTGGRRIASGGGTAGSGVGTGLTGTVGNAGVIISIAA